MLNPPVGENIAKWRAQVFPWSFHANPWREVKFFSLLCSVFDAKPTAMANQGHYGWKGGCFLRGLLYLSLFIILLIWVYYKNFQLQF